MWSQPRGLGHVGTNYRRLAKGGWPKRLFKGGWLEEVGSACPVSGRNRADFGTRFYKFCLFELRAFALGILQKWSCLLMGFQVLDHKSTGYIKRDANKVAHCLTQLALLIRLNIFGWRMLPTRLLMLFLQMYLIFIWFFFNEIHCY